MDEAVCAGRNETAADNNKNSHCCVCGHSFLVENDKLLMMICHPVSTTAVTAAFAATPSWRRMIEE